MVLDRLDRVKRNGARWSARCPAHPDKTPSLSIGTGDDGRVLLTCWAGCTVDDIVVSLGLDVRDLFPPRSSWGARSGPYRPPAPRPATSRPPAPTGPPTPVAEPVESSRWALPWAGELLAAWCRRRGFDPGVVIPTLELAVVVDRKGGYRVRFPFRYCGRLVHWSDRAIGSGKPKWLARAGAVPIPYRFDEALDVAHDRGAVMITEGPTDVAGLLTVAPDAPVLGVTGSAAWKPRWGRALDGLDVHVIVDRDAAGEKLRADLDDKLARYARTVAHHRLPGPWRDVAEWVAGDRAGLVDWLVAEGLGHEALGQNEVALAGDPGQHVAGEPGDPGQHVAGEPGDPGQHLAGEPGDPGQHVAGDLGPMAGVVR